MSRFEKAVSWIDQHGFLLVFSMKNVERPASLWSLLHPSVPMRWEWDDSGDNRLGDLWRLREELAASREVVYGKFYRGRATFFSKTAFRNCLCLKEIWKSQQLTPESQMILECLEMDSPLSTKQIKGATDLKGRYLEPTYHKAMKMLWDRLLIVGMGEVDDGAFPSLAHGATQVVFEDLWNEAQQKDPTEAFEELLELPESDLLLDYFF